VAARRKVALRAGSKHTKRGFRLRSAGDAGEAREAVVVELDWRGRPEVAQRRVALSPTSGSEYRVGGGSGPACAPRACRLRSRGARPRVAMAQGTRVGLGFPFARCQPKNMTCWLYGPTGCHCAWLSRLLSRILLEHSSFCVWSSPFLSFLLET